jgi:hypothetical protein
VALAALLVVFVGVTGILVLLHHSTSPPESTAPNAALTSASARLETATQAVDFDARSTRSTLDSLGGIPTPVKVATVINPFVSALQYYQFVLNRAEMPRSALGAAATVRASVSRDVQSLSAINGLTPFHLGSYLENFGTGTTQLRKDLGALERALRTPAN